jgi:hypothetical protein
MVLAKVVEVENHRVVEDYLEVEVNFLEVAYYLEVVGVVLLCLNPYP